MLELRLGYTWDPAIVPWLTQAIVLFPVGKGHVLHTVVMNAVGRTKSFYSSHPAAGLCIISALFTIPVLCSHRRDRYYPHPNYSLAVFLSFIVTLFACVFMVALVGVAIRRFNQLGISTHIGPSVRCSVVNPTLSILTLTFATRYGWQ